MNRHSQHLENSITLPRAIQILREKIIFQGARNKAIVLLEPLSCAQEISLFYKIKF